MADAAHAGEGIAHAAVPADRRLLGEQVVLVADADDRDVADAVLPGCPEQVGHFDPPEFSTDSVLPTRSCSFCTSSADLSVDHTGWPLQRARASSSALTWTGLL